VEALAHHAVHAEMWEEAVRYSREAGLRPGGGRDAGRVLEQALDALGHLHDDAEHQALAVDLRGGLARVLVPLGEQPRIVRMLREAPALATANKDHARLARTLAQLCSAYWEVGDSEGALETGARAVAVAEQVGDPDLRVMANFSLGGAIRAIGDYPRAVSLLRANLALTDGPGASLSDGRPRRECSRVVIWHGAWPSWVSFPRPSVARRRGFVSPKPPDRLTVKRIPTSRSAARCYARDGWPKR